MENCSSHIEKYTVDGLLKNIKTLLKTFPPKATKLIQAPYFFGIHNLNYSGREKWDLYKYKCVIAGG